jgi:hypothetical protein
MTLERPPSEIDEIVERVELPDGASEALENSPLCGGRREVTWTSGPMAGKRTSAWCAEPLCINTGYCTGAKFVPHTVQHDPDGTPRRLDPIEILPMVRKAAEMVTGKDDPRSDREIKAHVKQVYARMAAAVQGRWR